MFKTLLTPQRIFILTGLSLVVAAVLFSMPASDASAAVNASLICEPAFNGATCEARPIGSGYSYAWSTSGYLYIPSPCNGFFCSVACWGTGGGGTVTVTVTAPDGSYDSASRWVSCSSW